VGKEPNDTTARKPSFITTVIQYSLNNITACSSMVVRKIGTSTKRPYAKGTDAKYWKLYFNILASPHIVSQCLQPP
jgi:hypothetical protein